ncbi:MAG: hypothetical protein AAF078_07340 [Planctomycetota bacterium]
MSNHWIDRAWRAARCGRLTAWLAVAWLAVGFAAQAEPTAVNRAAAAQLKLMAQVTLSGHGDVSDAQVRVATDLLDAARELDPQWAELPRLQSELAGLSDDRPGQIAALAEYIKLTPDDSAAQLALIEARLAGLQTIDDRLSQLERVLDLGERSRLPEAVRSRLASTAATLALEQGDETRYARWLKESLSLDDANPFAAGLAYQLALERGAPAIELGTTATLLVRGRPTSADGRSALGSVLVSQAAYTRAADLFQTAVQLRRTELQPGFVELWMFSLAAANRSQDALALLQQYELSLASTDPPTPVPVSLQTMRLFLLQTSSFEPHRQQARQRFDEVKAALQPDIDTGSHDAALELAWISAVSGFDLDEAAATLERIGIDASPIARRAAGWLAISQDRPDAARELLAPQSDSDAWSRLGMVMLLPEEDNERRDALRRFVHEHPTQTAGLFAVRRLLAAGADAPPTAEGEVLLKLMQRYPRGMWEPDPRVSPWSLLRLNIGAARFSAGQPVELSVRLQNRSGMSLSIGPGGELPSTVLLLLTANSPGRAPVALPPITIDLARTVRLDAGAPVSTTVRLAGTPLGELMRQSPSTGWQVRGRALLNPVTGPAGGLVAGPFGGRADVGPFGIEGVDITPDTVESWIASLPTASDADRARTLARLASLPRWQTPGTPPGTVDEDTIQRAADALARSYESLSTAERFWTLRHLSTDDDANRLYRRLLDVAARSDEPIVQRLMAWQHAAGPDDPVIQQLERSATVEVRAFVDALTQVWADGALAPTGLTPAPAADSAASE